MLNAVQARVPADSIARPFAFLQESEETVSSREAVSSLSDASAAASVSLDWGDARYLGRFLWKRAATCVRLRVGLSLAIPQPGRV